MLLLVLLSSFCAARASADVCGSGVGSASCSAESSALVPPRPVQGSGYLQTQAQRPISALIRDNASDDASQVVEDCERQREEWRGEVEKRKLALVNGGKQLALVNGGAEGGAQANQTCEEYCNLDQACDGLIMEKCEMETCAACDQCQYFGFVPLNTTTSCNSSRSVKLNFFNSSIITNNLGGSGLEGEGGPSFTAREIRYRHIAAPGGSPIDLVITNRSEYTRTINGTNNGKNSFFGTVQVHGGYSVDLNFAFVDSLWGLPWTQEELQFSIFDLDESQNGKMQERWYVDGDVGYVVAENAEILVEKSLDNRTVFKSMLYGNGCDNPTDPDDLGVITCGSAGSVSRIKRSALLVFKNISDFTVTLEATCHGSDPCGSGRNFLFSGISQLSRACNE